MQAIDVFDVESALSSVRDRLNDRSRLSECVESVRSVLRAGDSHASHRHQAALYGIELIRLSSNLTHNSLMTDIRSYIARTAAWGANAAMTAAGTDSALSVQQLVFWNAISAFRRLDSMLDCVWKFPDRSTPALPSTAAAMAAMSAPLELVAPLIASIERVAAPIRPILPDTSFLNAETVDADAKTFSLLRQATIDRVVSRLCVSTWPSALTVALLSMLCDLPLTSHHCALLYTRVEHCLLRNALVAEDFPSLVRSIQTLVERVSFLAPSRDVLAISTQSNASDDRINLLSLRSGMIVDWISALRLALRVAPKSIISTLQFLFEANSLSPAFQSAVVLHFRSLLLHSNSQNNHTLEPQLDSTMRHPRLNLQRMSAFDWYLLVVLLRSESHSTSVRALCFELITAQATASVFPDTSASEFQHAILECARACIRDLVTGCAVESAILLDLATSWLLQTNSVNTSSVSCQQLGRLLLNRLFVAQRDMRGAILSTILSGISEEQIIESRLLLCDVLSNLLCEQSTLFADQLAIVQEFMHYAFHLPIRISTHVITAILPLCEAFPSFLSYMSMLFNKHLGSHHESERLIGLYGTCSLISFCRAVYSDKSALSSCIDALKACVFSFPRHLLERFLVLLSDSVCTNTANASIVDSILSLLWPRLSMIVTHQLPSTNSSMQSELDQLWTVTQHVVSSVNDIASDSAEIEVCSFQMVDWQHGTAGADITQPSKHHARVAVEIQFFDPIRCFIRDEIKTSFTNLAGFVSAEMLQPRLVFTRRENPALLLHDILSIDSPAIVAARSATDFQTPLDNLLSRCTQNFNVSVVLRGLASQLCSPAALRASLDCIDHLPAHSSNNNALKAALTAELMFTRGDNDQNVEVAPLSDRAATLGMCGLVLASACCTFASEAGEIALATKLIERSCLLLHFDIRFSAQLLSVESFSSADATSEFVIEAAHLVSSTRVAPRLLDVFPSVLFGPDHDNSSFVRTLSNIADDGDSGNTLLARLFSVRNAVVVLQAFADTCAATSSSTCQVSLFLAHHMLLVIHDWLCRLDVDSRGTLVERVLISRPLATHSTTSTTSTEMDETTPVADVMQTFQSVFSVLLNAFSAAHVDASSSLSRLALHHDSVLQSITELMPAASASMVLGFSEEGVNEQSQPFLDELDHFRARALMLLTACLEIDQFRVSKIGNLQPSKSILIAPETDSARETPLLGSAKFIPSSLGDVSSLIQSSLLWHLRVSTTQSTLIALLSACEQFSHVDSSSTAASQLLCCLISVLQSHYLDKAVLVRRVCSAMIKAASSISDIPGIDLAISSLLVQSATQSWHSTIELANVETSATKNTLQSILQWSSQPDRQQSDISNSKQVRHTAAVEPSFSFDDHADGHAAATNSAHSNQLPIQLRLGRGSTRWVCAAGAAYVALSHLETVLTRQTDAMRSARMSSKSASGLRIWLGSIQTVLNLIKLCCNDVSAMFDIAANMITETTKPGQKTDVSDDSDSDFEGAKSSRKRRVEEVEPEDGGSALSEHFHVRARVDKLIAQLVVVALELTHSLPPAIVQLRENSELLLQCITGLNDLMMCFDRCERHWALLQDAASTTSLSIRARIAAMNRRLMSALSQLQTDNSVVHAQSPDIPVETPQRPSVAIPEVVHVLSARRKSDSSPAAQVNSTITTPAALIASPLSPTPRLGLHRLPPRVTSRFAPTQFADEIEDPNSIVQTGNSAKPASSSGKSKRRRKDASSDSDDQNYEDDIVDEPRSSDESDQESRRPKKSAKHSNSQQKVASASRSHGIVLTDPRLVVPFETLLAHVSSRLATPSARGRRHNTGSARLHSRNQWIDQHLAVEDGRDSYADLADWIVPDEEASDDEPALLAAAVTAIM